jgi:hypothetical protein
MSTEEVFMNVYTNFIGDCLKLEITQMSINWGINKLLVVHPYKGILLRKK